MRWDLRRRVGARPCLCPYCLTSSPNQPLITHVHGIAFWTTTTPSRLRCTVCTSTRARLYSRVRCCWLSGARHAVSRSDAVNWPVLAEYHPRRCAPCSTPDARFGRVGFNTGTDGTRELEEKSRAYICAQAMLLDALQHVDSECSLSSHAGSYFRQALLATPSASRTRSFYSNLV